MIETISNNKNIILDNSKGINYESISAEKFISLLLTPNTNHKIEIKNKRIIDDLVINFTITKNFTIENCHFDSDVKFINCNLVGLSSFISCTSNAPIYFLSGKFERLSIDDFIGTQISFQGGEFNERCYISYNKIKDIDISAGYFKESLLIYGSNTHLNHNDEYPILLISLSSNVKVGNIYIYSGIFRQILLIDCKINDANIVINDIKTNGIYFHNFVNGDRFRFSNITPINEKSFIKIEHSDLGVCEFLNLDFTKFDLSIEDTLLTGVKTLNVVWPSEINSISLSAKKEQENYRQLKVAMLNQGDKIKALEFEKDEFNSYYRTLNWRHNFKDKFILATNWSNNHGQSWFRPLWLLICSTLLFFSLIKYLLGFTNFDFSYLPYDIGCFVNFINPAHSLKILNPSIDTNGYAYLFDSIFRIFSAYLLYQFIIAFRKYSNKK